MIVLRIVRMLGWFFLGVVFGGFLVVKSASAGYKVSLGGQYQVYSKSSSCADVLEAMNARARFFHDVSPTQAHYYYSDCSSDPVTASSSLFYQYFDAATNGWQVITIFSGFDDANSNVAITKIGATPVTGFLPIKPDSTLTNGLPVDLFYNSIQSTNAVPVIGDFSSTSSGNPTMDISLTGVDAPSIAYVFSWGMGAVLLMWSLGYAVGAAVRAIRSA